MASLDQHLEQLLSRGRSYSSREEARAALDVSQAALAAADGNRRAAARQLGVSLRTLFYKMGRYGLE